MNCFAMLTTANFLNFHILQKNYSANIKPNTPKALQNFANLSKNQTKCRYNGESL